MNSKLKAALITASIFTGVPAFILCLTTFPEQTFVCLMGGVLTLAIAGVYTIVLAVIETNRGPHNEIRKK